MTSQLKSAVFKLSLKQVLNQGALHKSVFLLAFPMVISNITVPLLGLVDAAVIGHLDKAWYLGGVALGGSIISLLYWLLGFLRMATTGIAAQAWGARDKQKLAKVFIQGAFLASSIGMGLILIHPFISELALSFTKASAEVKHYAALYFSIRIWSAPATLLNLVIMGWLLGTQDAKKPMLLIIVINLFNIGLDLLFVLGFDWKVQGAALASVLADYLGLLLGLFYVFSLWRSQRLPSFSLVVKIAFNDIRALLSLNRDIFLRSLCLQMSFIFMAFQGANLGDEVVAANAVLMNFLMLISFAMDGFAYAMEAMVGKAIGAKNQTELFSSLLVTTFWSLVIALVMSFIFGFYGKHIIDFMTDIKGVREQAYSIIPWLSALPLISMWCFLLDGIFVGATMAKEMRNTMFLALVGFFLVWFVFQSLENLALWLAMLTLMALRGLLLGAIFVKRWRQSAFF